jgi:peroxiredoxin
MLPLGTMAPSFALPDTNGEMIIFDKNSKGNAFLVMFICNHCPYVKHIASTLSLITTKFMEKGAVVYGINSNDIQNYPDDSPEQMAKEKIVRDYKFPYLFDESQQVARQYDAACTPDFYLFDKNRKLVYRGQLDNSRPGNNIGVTGADLCAAVESTLKGLPVNPDQKPSIGCNIKWKP